MKWTLPQKTDWMLKQMEHEPTRQYAQEIYETVKELKPDYKYALEIGAMWGVSALAILLAGNGHLTSVDNNLNIKAPDEIEANGLKNRWACFYERSGEFWPKNENSMFDLVYIDGSHLYDDVRNDFFEGWKRLNPGGLFMADDYLHPNNVIADENGKASIYGVSLALFKLIQAKDIRAIGTKSKIFYAVKPV